MPQFAARIGAHRNAVMRWEAGQNRPRVASLERIAQTCGVTVAQLVDGKGARWTTRDGYAEAQRLLRAVWRTPSRRALVLRLLRSLEAAAG